MLCPNVFWHCVSYVECPPAVVPPLPIVGRSSPAPATVTSSMNSTPNRGDTSPPSPSPSTAADGATGTATYPTGVGARGGVTSKGVVTLNRATRRPPFSDASDADEYCCFGRVAATDSIECHLTGNRMTHTLTFITFT